MALIDPDKPEKYKTSKFLEQLRRRIIKASFSKTLRVTSAKYTNTPPPMEAQFDVGGSIPKSGHLRAENEG